MTRAMTRAVTRPLTRAAVLRPDEWMANAAAGAPTVFGDGRHPSTRLAATSVARELCRRRRGASFLDAGCGTGTLTAMAARLGSNCTAVDRFEGATAETSRRTPRARVYLGELANHLVESLGSFDIIAANLPENELCVLASSLRAALAPGGVLISTGFLLCRVGTVTKMLEAAGSLSVSLDVSSHLGYAACRFSR